MDLNRVMLAGRLTADPEVRSLPSGTSVANFGLAVNRRWRDKQTNELREEACFVDIEAFDRTAEMIKTYFAKGKPIFIEGRLKLDQWETKEGEKRSKLKVRVERWTFVPDGKPRDAAEGQSAASPPRERRSLTSAVLAAAEPSESEAALPF